MSRKYFCTPLDSLPIGSTFVVPKTASEDSGLAELPDRCAVRVFLGRDQNHGLAKVLVLRSTNSQTESIDPCTLVVPIRYVAMDYVPGQTTL